MAAGGHFITVRMRLSHRHRLRHASQQGASAYRLHKANSVGGAWTFYSATLLLEIEFNLRCVSRVPVITTGPHFHISVALSVVSGAPRGLWSIARGPLTYSLTYLLTCLFIYLLFVCLFVCVAVVEITNITLSDCVLGYKKFKNHWSKKKKKKTLPNTPISTNKVSLT